MASLELRAHRYRIVFRKGMHAHALERLTAVEQENVPLRGEVARLNAQLFGQKSEKQTRKDRSHHLDGLEDADDTESKPAPRPRKGPQRRDSSPLPARAELVELPEAEQVCPRWGQPWRERSDTAATQVDPQDSPRQFGVVGDSAGQVRQLSADQTTAGRLETAGLGDHGEYRGRPLATASNFWRSAHARASSPR